MARQENPIEKYGMARYDVANRKPRGQEGTFQQRGGNQARDEARAAARETTAPTFGELQAQGRARPAPVQTAAMPHQGGDVNANGGMNPIEQARDRFYDERYARDQRDAQWNPSPRFNDSVYQQNQPRQATTTAAMTTEPGTLNPNVNPINSGQLAQGQTGLPAILANLEAQFSGQRRRLNEDLARRGLWSSSGNIGASGMLGELEADQSRAIASASTNWQMNQDERYDQLMRSLLPIFLGNGG